MRICTTSFCRNPMRLSLPWYGPSRTLNISRTVSSDAEGAGRSILKHDAMVSDLPGPLLCFRIDQKGSTGDETHQPSATTQTDDQHSYRLPGRITPLSDLSSSSSSQSFSFARIISLRQPASNPSATAPSSAWTTRPTASDSYGFRHHPGEQPA